MINLLSRRDRWFPRFVAWGQCVDTGRVPGSSRV